MTHWGFMGVYSSPNASTWCGFYIKQTNVLISELQILSDFSTFAGCFSVFPGFRLSQANSLLAVASYLMDRHESSIDLILIIQNTKEMNFPKCWTPPLRLVKLTSVFFLLSINPIKSPKQQRINATNKYCQCTLSLVYFIPLCHRAPLLSKTHQWATVVPGDMLLWCNKHNHCSFYSSVSPTYSTNALFTPVWVIFAKNYSALLLWEITFLKMKLHICNLFLKVYIFSRNQWACGSATGTSESIERWMHCWFRSFNEIWWQNK